MLWSLLFILILVEPETIKQNIYFHKKKIVFYLLHKLKFELNEFNYTGGEYPKIL